MRRLSLYRVAVVGLAVAGAASVADGAPSAPPVPETRGEWIAFAWVDPTPLDAGPGRAAAAETLEGVLATVWGAMTVMSAEDRAVLAGVADAAARGRASTLWLAPHADGDSFVLRLGASVHALESGQPAVLGTLPQPGATPLRAAAPLLGPEGFAEWPAHRAAAAKIATEGRPVLELAFNVDAVRHAAVGEFEAGPSVARGAALLNALRLGSARVVGMHGRLVSPAKVGTRDPSLPKRPGAATESYQGPPLLTLTATWTSRSEPPGVVRGARLTASYWPLSQVGPPHDPAAGLVMAVRTTWRPMLDAALDVYDATLPSVEAPAFIDRRRAWTAASAPSIAAMVGGMEPWLLADVPVEEARRSELRLAMPLRADTTAAAGSQLLSTLSEGLGADGKALPGARWRIHGITWRVIDGRPGRIECVLRPAPAR